MHDEPKPARSAPRPRGTRAAIHPTYFEEERDESRRRARLIRRLVSAVRSAALTREMESGHAALREWVLRVELRRGPFFLPQPRQLRRGALSLRDLALCREVYRALVPEGLWWYARPKARWRPTDRPNCPDELYARGEPEEALALWLSRSRRLRRRLKAHPRLAGEVRREVFQTTRTRGGGVRPAHQSPESLAAAVLGIILSKDPRAITRAPARVMRAMRGR